MKFNFSIFNYLVAIYMSVFAYENLLHYTFHIALPISVLKPMILILFFLLIFITRNIKKGLSFLESFFLIYIVLLFIFSYIYPSLGLGYSLTMFFIFGSLYLLKYIKEYLDFNKIISITLWLNIPLIVINLVLMFNSSFYTYKMQFFGTHGNPNVFGMWILFVLVLIYLYPNRNRMRNILFTIVFIMIIASISRSTIVSSLFIVILYFKDNKKIIYITSAILSIIFIYYASDIQFIKAILNRFSGDSARDFSSMFNLIINNNFLPNGTNTFSYLMEKQGSIPDNSYLFVISDLGFLGIIYFIPFIYVFIFSNIETKFLIFPLLFQSIFEKVLIATTSSYLFLILLIIIVFPERLKIYKLKLARRIICN